MALAAAPAWAQETALPATSAPPEDAGFVEPAAALVVTQPPDYEEPPNQLAWASLIVGGACLATGIGFGVAAVVEDRASDDIIEGTQGDQSAALAAQSSYQDSIDTRDGLRVISGIAAGTGLGLFLIAGALFARDDIARMDRAVPPQASLRTSLRRTSLRTSLTTSLAAHPWLGPGLAGGSAKVSF